jgi:hypothetical protein
MLPRQEKRRKSLFVFLDFLSTTVRPEAAKASPKDFYDTTILDRLEK